MRFDNSSPVTDGAHQGELKDLKPVVHGPPRPLILRTTLGNMPNTTNCSFTELNWSTGKRTVVKTRNVSFAGVDIENRSTQPPPSTTDTKFMFASDCSLAVWQSDFYVIFVAGQSWMAITGFDQIRSLGGWFYIDIARPFDNRGFH